MADSSSGAHVDNDQGDWPSYWLTLFFQKKQLYSFCQVSYSDSLGITVK